MNIYLHFQLEPSVKYTMSIHSPLNTNIYSLITFYYFPELSNLLSIYLSNYLPASKTIYLTIQLSTCIKDYLFIYPTIYMHQRISIYLSNYLLASKTIYLSIYPTIYLHQRLSINLCILNVGCRDNVL